MLCRGGILLGHNSMRVSYRPYQSLIEACPCLNGNVDGVMTRAVLSATVAGKLHELDLGSSMFEASGRVVEGASFLQCGRPPTPFAGRADFPPLALQPSGRSCLYSKHLQTEP